MRMLWGNNTNPRRIWWLYFWRGDVPLARQRTGHVINDPLSLAFRSACRQSGAGALNTIGQVEIVLHEPAFLNGDKFAFVGKSFDEFHFRCPLSDPV
jgi:hypothetical protein